MSIYSIISQRSLAALAVVGSLAAVLAVSAAPAGAAPTSAAKDQALVSVAAGIYPVASCARKEAVVNFTGRGTVERRVAFFPLPVSSAKRVASLSAQFKRRFPHSVDVAVSKQLLGGRSSGSKRVAAGAYVVAGGIAGIGRLVCTTSRSAAQRELDSFFPGGLDQLIGWGTKLRDWGKSIAQLVDEFTDPSSTTGIICGPPREGEGAGDPGSGVPPNDHNDPEGNPNNVFHDATER